jgi:hypothetical protein
MGVESNWVNSKLRPQMTYCACPGWLLWWCRNWWNAWQGKQKYSEKTSPSAAFVYHKPHMLPGCEPGPAATNRLSYGTAVFLCKARCVNNVWDPLKLATVINSEYGTWVGLLGWTKPEIHMELWRGELSLRLKLTQASLNMKEIRGKC